MLYRLIDYWIKKKAMIALNLIFNCSIQAKLKSGLSRINSNYCFCLFESVCRPLFLHRAARILNAKIFKRFFEL